MLKIMENTSQMKTKLNKVCVIGCGYVGLPLALELSRSSKNVVIGLDISSDRINELQNNYDSTREVSTEDLESVNITFTDDYNAVSMCNIYIVTVPTPIDENFFTKLQVHLVCHKSLSKHFNKK